MASDGARAGIRYSLQAQSVVNTAYILDSVGLALVAPFCCYHHNTSVVQLYVPACHAFK